MTPHPEGKFYNFNLINRIREHSPPLQRENQSVIAACLQVSDLSGNNSTLTTLLHRKKSKTRLIVPDHHTNPPFDLSYME